MTRPPFDFAALDSLLRAKVRGRSLPEKQTYDACRLGPFLELRQATKAIPAEQRLEVTSTVALPPTVKAALRVSNIDLPSTYDSFRIDAHKAALSAGFSSSTAAKIVAALSELASNIIEHSDHQSSGRIAFVGGSGIFEFVVADLGIGPLNSLRKYDGYSHLSSHGEALALMMEEGTSRFGPAAARGFGYRPLFVWLANLTGHLRFRAGDFALELDGRFGDKLAVQLSQKPLLRGYFASVCCVGPA